MPRKTAGSARIDVVMTKLPTGAREHGAFLALAVALVAAVGCGVTRSPDSPGVVRGAAATVDGVASNITRADYAGSKACEGCHADVARTWAASPMHRMTRVPEEADVHAPFDGTVFRFKGDSAELFTRGTTRFMRIVAAATTAKGPASTHLYRVTRIIGGRVREDFAGVEVASDAVTSAARGGGDELVLPVSYLVASGTFRVKGYSVMVDARPGLRAGGVWNQTCILCHNTNPYFSSLYGELLGPGAPTYQGEVVDRLLPPSRRASFVVTDPAGLKTAAIVEARHMGVGARDRPASDAPRDALDLALRTTRSRLTASHLVEVGIGCESCHGGSLAHVENPTVRPSYEPRAPFLASVLPPRSRGASARVKVAPLVPQGADPQRAERVNRVCARCHQVLFSRYPYTWEGGRRDAMGGGSHITSGEGRDYLLGGCASAMTCTTCHDPHGNDAAAKLDALATPAGNRTCTTCHATLASDDALRAHAHHNPEGNGGACVACHMPKKNMGLGYALTRYHRIGSPNDKARVEKDRPLECALCHADKSVASLVGTMESWWGTRYDRTALRGLYDDLDADALAATLDHGKPHEIVTAMMALAENGRAVAAPKLLPSLNHRYPLVRYFAREALQKLTGAPFPRGIDLDADDEQAVLRAAAAYVAQSARK